MKALVISGGGSKGAFAGGVAEFLIRDLGKNYDIFVGSSTGSLLIPHLSIHKIDRIKEAYTRVTQSDIYTVCPFRVSAGKNGDVRISINHLNTLWMFIRGKKTFGDHSALRRTIEEFFRPQDYEMIRQGEKKVIVTVSNLSRTTVEYKYLNDHSYSDFCDWMWASCSFVPFMSIVEKDGYEYADGGFGKYIPVQEAINLGATEIDVIVLNPRRRSKKHIKTSNAFDVLLKSLLFMQKQIVYDDILIGHLEGIFNRDVNVNFIFTPRILTEYSFYFDPKQMRTWWEEGYEYARSLYANI